MIGKSFLVSLLVNVFAVSANSQVVEPVNVGDNHQFYISVINMIVNGIVAVACTIGVAWVTKRFASKGNSDEKY